VNHLFRTAQWTVEKEKKNSNIARSWEIPLPDPSTSTSSSYSSDSPTGSVWHMLQDHAYGTWGSKRKDRFLRFPIIVEIHARNVPWYYHLHTCLVLYSHSPMPVPVPDVRSDLALCLCQFHAYLEPPYSRQSRDVTEVNPSRRFFIEGNQYPGIFEQCYRVPWPKPCPLDIGDALSSLHLDDGSVDGVSSASIR